MPLPARGSPVAATVLAAMPPRRQPSATGLPKARGDPPLSQAKVEAFGATPLLLPGPVAVAE